MANKKKKSSSSKKDDKKVKNSSSSDKKDTTKKNVKKNKSNSKSDRKNADRIYEVGGGVDDNFTHILIVASVIVIVFAVFYFLSAYISRESRQTEENEVQISYTDIILGRSFDMDYEKYYVLYYDKSDEEISSTYSSLFYSYDDTDIPLFVVDMSSAFNSGFASEESNKEATSATEIKINGPTLILFNGKKIENYYEGEAEIKEVLSDEE